MRIACLIQFQSILQSLIRKGFALVGNDINIGGAKVLGVVHLAGWKAG